jgi:23S rRNA (uracil1939-C5)-methyltransferase
MRQSGWVEVVLRPERLVAGGDALARAPDGRVVFIAGAVPGDVVRVAVRSVKRDFARADVVEVLEASPDRVEPPCPNLARGCGGCDWQHLSVAAQRRWRLAIVTEALARTGRLPDAEVRAGPELSASAGRTTLRLAIDSAGRPGLRGRRSHDVVALDDCLVAHPLIAGLLPELHLRGASEVVLRCGAATGERAAWWQPVRAEAAGLPADVRTGEDAVIHEVVAGNRLRVSAGAFFQSSLDGAEALVAAVADAAAGCREGTSVVDAYGGVGLFAAAVAGRARHVTLVEDDPTACADARHNLADRPVTVVRARMERWTATAAELVIADPARAGLGRDAAAVLAATGAARVVLVSCDAVSLARDAALLAGLGYNHRWSVVLDLFPHTSHVEVVTRFDRR